MTEPGPKPRERPRWYTLCRGITNHDLRLVETRFFWRRRNNFVCSESKCNYSVREPCNPHFPKQRARFETGVVFPTRCFLKQYLPPVYWVVTKCGWVFQGFWILLLLFGSTAVALVLAFYATNLFI